MNHLNRSLKSTINLGNSIIGVSILAMPLCFKQVGIVLSLLVLGLSVLLNQFSCYLLLKSAIINRRRNYELLAFDVFGAGGKTLVEICVLLYLLGTCIAFFVIVGDIAPSLVAHIFDIDNGPHLRTLIVTALGMFVIFPLGLLRNVENLTSFSMISLGVYLFLALRMISLAFDKFLAPSAVNIWSEVTYWDSSFVISYLPIFSMALSCQGQIFEIFHPDLFNADLRSLKYMMRSTKRALYITSMVYTLIGLFGYLAFYDVAFTGNILQSLPTGFATKATLLLFLITLLTSFPLCLFPCRTSLHSLLFRKGGYSDVLSTAHSVHMSDHHFRLLTMVLIVTTMCVSVLFPHVELVLALVGSTIGAVICFIVPALIFIKLSDKNTIEYLFSYLLIFFGTIILVFCTFSALHSISVARDVEIEEKINEIKSKPVVPPKTAASLAQVKVPIVPPVAIIKDHHSNMTKLKATVKTLDMTKLKKQEEILSRLEKQQQEHMKMLKEQREIINELKSHDKVFHDEKAPRKDLNLNKDIASNGSISLKVTSSLPLKGAKDAHKMDQREEAPVPSVQAKRSLSSNGSLPNAQPALLPNVITPDLKTDHLKSNISIAVKPPSEQSPPPLQSSQLTAAEAKRPISKASAIVTSQHHHPDSLSHSEKATRLGKSEGDAVKSNPSDIKATPVKVAVPAEPSNKQKSTDEKVAERSKDRDI